MTGSGTLTITRADLATVLDHCIASLPNEACGILGGREGRIEKVYCMRNTRPGPVSYEMDPDEQLRVMKDLRQEGLALSAIFHSHPASPAYPSGTDVERAYWPGTLFPNYPEAAYLIVSLRDRDRPDVKAFMIRDGTVQEALLQIA
jgi:proteasome lid subunit RPN8/RPN11